MSAHGFQVNGVPCEVPADPGRSLLHVLREDLDLTGCKPGCGEGECGACTVLVDGRAVRSCITPVGAAAGRRVTTVEGLAGAHPLQEAFLDLDALQCGYCTPGMIMSGVDLLSRIPSPTVDEVVQNMQGNICRCGAYPRIVAAIRVVAARIGDGRVGEGRVGDGQAADGLAADRLAADRLAADRLVADGPVADEPAAGGGDG